MENDVAHYVKAFHYLESGGEIPAHELEIFDIAEKIRYFQQKYTRKIRNIMDIGPFVHDIEQLYPGESVDLAILRNMRDRILETLNERILPSSSGSDMSGIDRVQWVGLDALRQKNKLLEAILNSTSLGTWFIDKEFRIRYTNAALCELFGYTEQELKGRLLFDFFHGKDKEELIAKASLMDTQEHRYYTLDLARKDDTYLPVSIQATTIRVDGEVIWAVAFLADISEFRNRESKLQKRAITDALTWVYNRRFFDEKWASSIKQLDEGKLHSLSFALIDADYFKKINDEHGHPVGDRVLKNIGELLLSLDIPGISVFRYGGEEFALIGKNIPREEMLRIAEDLRQRVADMVVTFREWTLQLTISIGVETCIYEPGNLHDIKRSLKTTDEYLYAAKAAGRNCIMSALGKYIAS